MRERYISLYVEWTGAKDVPGIRQFLERNGAREVFEDGDMDDAYIPGRSFRYALTVFRFRADRTVPVHALLSALAAQPGVYSAGEV